MVQRNIFQSKSQCYIDYKNAFQTCIMKSVIHALFAEVIGMPNIKPSPYTPRVALDNEMEGI